MDCVFIYGGGFAKKVVTILFMSTTLETNTCDALTVQAMETKQRFSNSP